MVFCSVRVAKLSASFHHGFADMGFGGFLWWIALQAEKKNEINSNNFITINNKIAAKALGVTTRTIIEWKQRALAAHIIFKTNKPKTYVINKQVFYKGKVAKT